MSDPTTPNMGLTTPVVGPNGTPSPTWATELNMDMALIDQHNHAAGNGVLITPSGLSISSDLSFINNNATSLRSARFTSQTSPLMGALDLGAVYVSGVDLWYNDENGNQIQLTSHGSVAGTSGSIGGLTPPASVTYVSATPAFVFQSAVNTSANLDAGSLTIRQNTANANGITLSSPNSLASNYSLVFPGSLPTSPGVVAVDTSGNISIGNTLNGQNLLVSNTNAAKNLSVVRFRVTTASFAATILSGEGVSATFVSAGNASIGFNTPFADVPSIAGTCENPGYVVTLNSVSSGGFVFQSFASSGSLQACVVDFIVIGQI